MSLPESLQGDKWTRHTARTCLPLIIWCAQNGRTITYGQLDNEIVRRGWGHHVMAVQYGHPAGAIGSALLETEEEWGDKVIPPINALIVNQKTELPGDGVNWYLEQYCEDECDVDEFSLDEKRALVEEIHADIFSYEYWDDILKEYGMEPVEEGLPFYEKSDNDGVSKPSRGGWSSEGESENHLKLKNYIANNPQEIGLSKSSNKGIIEYIFASSDKADVVFKNNEKYTAIEVKSNISNDNDLNRGIFQCIKYQALLRAEQKSENIPPTARAILVTERELPSPLLNLADLLNVKVVVCVIN